MRDGTKLNPACSHCCLKLFILESHVSMDGFYRPDGRSHTGSNRCTTVKIVISLQTSTAEFLFHKSMAWKARQPSNRQ